MSLGFRLPFLITKSRNQSKSPVNSVRPTKMKKFRSAHNFVLASLWAAIAVVSPVAAQHGENPDALANPQPGFLEIARNPNANPAQKRTIDAMMDFVRETDPEPALEKLKALDTFVLYGGGDDGLTDLMPLSGLSLLRTLWISRNQISDVSPLKGLNQLRDLHLSATT
jgi:Leucine-rich repeat (LRR) protein